MNVVNPNDTAHEIVIIPRYYPSDAIVVDLFNEAKQTSEIVENTYGVENGKLTLRFDYEFIEGGRFQIKITEASEVVYRGKIFATTQEPQNYSTSTNAYYY